MKKPAHSIKLWMSLHKFWSVCIIVAVLILGYYVYHRATAVNAAPQYTLAFARNSKITQTISGSGQVSASNQTDIQSQVSGTITAISTKVGQPVATGQLIATIDPTNAQIALKNAELAFDKIVEPAKATDISNAQNSLFKSYNDAFNSASTIYLDLPAVISGMKDLLYGQAGVLSDQQSAFLNPTARDMRQKAAVEYDAAVAQYQKAAAEFNGLTRSSATSSIDNMLTDTYTTVKDMAKSLSDTQSTLTFIQTSQPDYKTSGIASAATQVNAWSTQTNSDLSNLLSGQNSITTGQNALSNLQAGADTLDVQTARLNLEQAQRTYNNYFIRAPYDGTIGRIPVNVYGQAGASTVIATIVGNQKIATISLNEVDAAKISDGQPVMITFDAIDGLNATGTVEQVDQVGTVSSGVVSYGVKILINTADDRIKPGMSVNTSIITKEDDNVLVVPSNAVKKQGNQNYVQTLPRSVLATLASSTASSTRSRNFTSANSGGARAMTISSVLVPTQVSVTVGDYDDTNTEILSGLNPGTLVITKTTTGTAAQTTSAPSILNTLGGGRGGAGGGTFRGAAGAGR